MSDQNEEFQAQAGQPGGTGLPTPRPTVRERSRRFFVRLPTDVDATEGVGAELASDEVAVDPDAATQEAAYQAWSASETYVSPTAADAYGYPQETYYQEDGQPEQPAPWGGYPEEAVAASPDAAPEGDSALDAYAAADGAFAAPEALDVYAPLDSTQPNELPSEPQQRPLAEQEYIPEAYDTQVFPTPAEPEATAWQPEALADEVASEPFPGASEFLGSTAQETAATAPVWAEPLPESSVPVEAPVEVVAPAEVVAPTEEVAVEPFSGQPAWAAPVTPEQPAWAPAPPAEPEPAGVGDEPAAPSWSFARPQPETVEPVEEAFASGAARSAPPEPAPPEQFVPEQPVQPETVPAVEYKLPPAAEQAQEPAEVAAAEPEPVAASGWTPPAKDWSSGPSWGGSRSSTKPKPATAPSLLEDPVAAAGLYIPGDVERFEGDMPLFGDNEVMGPLWQGDGLGEPLFIDFNDLPQMLAGLRQLLPKGTRLTYNYDHERAWVRSYRDVDLAAYAESVRSLMWQREEAGAPEQASS